MKKRLISMLLVFCMIFSLLPAQALAVGPEKQTETSSANPFTDIHTGDWYCDAVQYVYRNGIFSGTSKTTFWPQGTMTRGMFVTVLGRMAGVNTEDYDGPSSFTDVSEDAWYTPFVNWAAKYGITSGTGGGKFSPDAYIDRQQMAALFVNYFKAFDVDYTTGTNITSVPGDLDSIAPWAKDSVLALWKEGLLNGDGKNFMPVNNAARAEAAMLCMRFDDAVTVWYSAPGVQSERVPVGNETPEPTPTPKPGGSTGGSSGGNSGGSTTTYYNVTFAMGAGESTDGLTLPESKLYVSGTKLSDLPIPYKQNAAFLGWYYDEGLTDAVESGDTLTRNLTLYGKMAGITPLSEQETPNYNTRKLEPGSGGSFTFEVTAASENTLRAALTITDITGSNASIPYTVTGSEPNFTVTPRAIPDPAQKGELTAGLEDGKTYKIALTEDTAVSFAGQSESVRSLNVVTEKEDADELEVVDGMRYVQKNLIDGNAPLEGLFTASLGADGDTQIAPVEDTGTFTYTGTDELGETINVGDTVAIYTGTRPDQRAEGALSDGSVAYVVITEKNGNKYTYRTAEAEEVLFTPDVLPFDTGADDDSVDGTYTASKSDLNFSDPKYAGMGLNVDTTIDVGDFIAFYTGDLATAQSTTYGKITDVSIAGDTYTITYETASLDDLMAAMDLYSEQDKPVEMSEEDQRALEEEIKQEVIDSNFAEEAGLYLAALALETDGFQELADDFDYELTAYSLTTADGQPLEPGELALMGNSKVTVDPSVTVSVGIGRNKMQHFEGRDGMRVELNMLVTVTVGDKFEIKINAIFEQEVVLGLTVSGGAEWRWAWIIPYIYDYNLNAAFTAGTYTGIGITATASTKGDDDEFDWGTTTGNDAGDKIVNIGKQIHELMEEKDKFFGKDWSKGGENEDAGETSVGGSLTDKYADMIKNADDTWIDLCRVEIFSKEGAIDKLNILVYGITADFVISANVYVTMGMSFTYAVAKEYVFSVSVFHKGVTSEVVDLEESNYRFDFYVMGTLGIRAGIEFEIAVGLFSLKLDSVGFTAEAGVYAQLWGFFYYSVQWSASGGKSSGHSGAMCVEVGAYLEITFKAQAFGDKLKYEPTLYANQWPFWTAGEAFNIMDFTTAEDSDDLNIELVGVKTATLPATLFEMTGFDLQTGDIYDGEDGHKAPKTFDDETESHYSISISDPTHFEYHAASNTILVKPGEKDYQLEGTMTLTWNQAPLSFNSEAVSRTVKISWEASPADICFIAFNSLGGSPVDTILAPPGEPIQAPIPPRKDGWQFNGWYLNGNPYPFPYYMPDLGLGSGCTLEASWVPGTNTSFTVEYYKQGQNGSYTRVTDRDELAAIGGREYGTTGQLVSDHMVLDPYKAPAGYVYNEKLSTDKSDTPIEGNGSTTVQVYFDRGTYTATFDYGDKGGYGLEPVVKKVRFGDPIVAPILERPGYTMDPTSPWDAALPETMPAQNLNFSANWKPNTDTPYTVAFFTLSPNGIEVLYKTLSYTGTTDTAVPASVYQDVMPEGYGSYTLRVDGGDALKPEEVIIASHGRLRVRCYFHPLEYSVSFDLNGGFVQITGSEPSQKTLRYGSTLDVPPDCTLLRNGYTFDCWVDKDTGLPWEFGTNGTKVTKDTVLQAKWNSNSGISYQVEYYVQDTTGDGFTRDTTKTENPTGKAGETVTITPKDIAGLTFDSANQNNVLSGTVDPNTTLVLKLYYTRKTSTVTFKSDNTVYSGPTTLRYGAFINPPTAPTKPGYEFAGWYEESAPGTTINFSGLTMGEEPLVYHAKWSTAVYRISYTLDGGTHTNPATYTSEAGLTLTAPAKEGYTFAGWSGTDLTGENNLTVTIPAGSTGDRAYTAHWAPITYTVHFDANGGAGTMADQTFTYDVEQAINANTFTKQGNRFAGWDLMINGVFTAACADGKVVINLTDSPGVNITFKAQWTPSGDTQYTVKHHQQNVTGSDYTLADTETLSNGNAGQEKTAAPKTYTGFTVKSTEAERTATIAADGSTVINVYYDRLTYDVTFNLNGGTGTPPASLTDVRYGAAITKPTDPTPPAGKKFSHWQDGDGTTWNFETSTVQGATTLTAIWTDVTEVTYTVNTYTMDVNGNYPANPATVTKSVPIGTNVDVIADGTVIVGAGFTLDTAKSTTAGNVDTVKVFNVYLQRNRYQLTWNLGDGTPSNEDSYTTSGLVYFGAPIVVPDLTGPNAKPGYTLDAWGVEIPATMPTNNLSFTASWGLITYTITYTNPDDTYWNTGNRPNTYTIEDTPVVINASQIRTGYTFAGWTGSNGETPQIAVTIPAGSTGNKAYTSSWTPKKITVSFDGNGGSNPANIQKDYGSTFGTNLPTPTRDGYTFLGWQYMDRQERVGTVTPTLLITDDTVKITNWELTPYLTLTATWEKNPEPANLVIHTNLPDGTGEARPYYIEPDSIIDLNRLGLHPPDGYKFAGLRTKSGETVFSNGQAYSYEELFDGVVNFPLELYAVWEPV